MYTLKRLVVLIFWWFLSSVFLVGYHPSGQLPSVECSIHLWLTETQEKEDTINFVNVHYTSYTPTGGF